LPYIVGSFKLVFVGVFFSFYGIINVVIAVFGFLDCYFLVFLFAFFDFKLVICFGFYFLFAAVMLMERVIFVFG